MMTLLTLLAFTDDHSSFGLSLFQCVTRWPVLHCFYSSEHIVELTMTVEHIYSDLVIGVDSIESGALTNLNVSGRVGTGRYDDFFCGLGCFDFRVEF
jgi:hypothetical protein